MCPGVLTVVSDDDICSCYGSDAGQIRYQSLGASSPEVATVNSSRVMSFNLTALKKFVIYRLQMLAYTSVGDGVISSPAISVRTFEDGMWLNDNNSSKRTVLTCCNMHQGSPCFL